MGADTIFVWVVQRRLCRFVSHVTCRSSESVSSWCKRISRHSRRRNRLRLWSLRTQWCHQCLPRPCHPWRRHGGYTDLTWAETFISSDSIHFQALKDQKNDNELNMESCWKSLCIGTCSPQHARLPLRSLRLPWCHLCLPQPCHPWRQPNPSGKLLEIGGKLYMGVSLNGGPPKHPKVIIFSRKTHGCWVPPF